MISVKNTCIKKLKNLILKAHEKFKKEILTLEDRYFETW